MTRLMYDSVNPGNIPTNAQMVAGYIDGNYRWSPADWARFPNSVLVPIAVFSSTNDGVVLDVEAGNAKPNEAVRWVLMRRAAGIDPTIYCSTEALGYNWALVINAFITAGVPEPHYWVAAYPGIGSILYPDSVAHQYANPGPYDLSVVADYWPGIDPTPTTTIPEDIVATLADLQAALAANNATILEALSGPVYYKFDGANLAWWDLGNARVRLTRDQYDAHPATIHVLSVTDPFWAKPVIGDAYGEFYRRVGQTAAWVITSDPSRTSTGVRFWAGRQAYLDAGSPAIIDLPASHSFWTLPTVGVLPPEGA